ncbi:peptidoglycan-binding domain-containing protein [Mycolicibacterium tusciae]|uniref:peptidoglycan-binding domain-containing protein n=1 Tax=Mycolicibacterium tusciae TaxID=75922 RepID=UPI00024A1F6B|nr:peptidoglycan-binding domain-containing protein [Mycolicibacterium tusciae]
MAVILRPGEDNDLVRQLQARLNRDYPRYSQLVVDGIYGPATTAVVFFRAFPQTTLRISSGGERTVG